MSNRVLPDNEIRLAQELVVKMGECSASYHIITQLDEINRLRAINAEMCALLKDFFDNYEFGDVVDRKICNVLGKAVSQ